MSTVVLYSGGVDSTVALYAALPDVHAIGFDYGQEHVEELEAAKAICADLGVPFEIVKLDVSFLSKRADGLVFPNRNMIFLSVAAAYALTHGIESVTIACHGGDHELFPDCRPAFLDAAWQTLNTATNGAVKLLRPFVRMSKAEVVHLGREMGVPFERTRSCYGKGEPCGVCLACREREKAFVLERTENPHPRMLREALELRSRVTFSAIDAGLWRGFLAAMCAATGESPEAIEAWMDRVGG